MPIGGFHSQVLEVLHIKPGPLPEQSESVLQEVAGVGVGSSTVQLWDSAGLLLVVPQEFESAQVLVWVELEQELQEEQDQFSVQGS